MDTESESIDTALAAPKKVTNASGESVESRSADEIIALLDRKARVGKRIGLGSIIRAIPPGTVGPLSSDAE